MSRKYGKTLEGFFAQQKERGIPLTPEIQDYYEDVKYDELPFWRKWFTDSPQYKRDFARDFLRGLPEFFRESDGVKKHD